MTGWELTVLSISTGNGERRSKKFFKERGGRLGSFQTNVLRVYSPRAFAESETKKWTWSLLMV